MFPPTPEQASIGDSIISGKSVIVNAVAGSGKTTTVLSIAKRMPLAHILQITYNTALKLEVRKKVSDENLNNLEVHTYHSFARTYYDPDTSTDMGIESSLLMQPNNLPDFNIVIIDECQDMTPLLFEFARKLVKDIQGSPTLGLFGDDMQTVYHFKKADPRYLTLGEQLWPERSFVHHKLGTSFRLTNKIAGYVNEGLLGYHKVDAPRPGPPVQYIVTEGKNPSDVIIPMIFTFFSEGLKASDIFVLAPSIAENNYTVLAIENSLVMHNIPVHIPNQDDRTLDDDVMRNKVVFSTFHQSKGRERKVTIVIGLDGSYSKTFARELPRDQCPSTAYVACTRSSQHLIIVQEDGKRAPAFLKHPGLKHADVLGGSVVTDLADPIEESHTYRERRTCVTKLVRHLSHELVTKLNNMVESIVERTRDPGNDLGIKNKTKTGLHTFEDVSEINAFALSAMWEYKSGEETPTIFEKIESCRKTRFTESHIEQMTGGTSIKDFLYAANIFRAITTRQLFKLKQVKTYDWVTEQQATSIMDNYNSCCQGESPQFEYPVAVREYKIGRVSTSITGSIDILTSTDAIETKCTTQLQLEHFLQIILYKWMWNLNFKKTEGQRDFKLINVLTAETWKIGGTDEEISLIADILIKEKYLQSETENDSEFVARCNEIDVN